MSDPTSQSPSLSRGARRLGWLLAGVFTLLLLELGSCGYLRVARGYDGAHLMNYQFDPYKIVRLTPDYRDTRGIAHNTQGFRRDVDTARERPEGSIRIFLMGGSTAYGLRSLSQHGKKRYPVIRNDETIDHYLEQYLQERIPDRPVEVINAAITSFYSHHHLIYLNQAVLKYDPTMVVFLDGFNDYFKSQKGFDQWAEYAYQERVTAFMNEPTLEAWARYTGWWLFRRSHFAHLAGLAARDAWSLLRPRGERGSIEVEPALQNLQENARNNFAKMVERNALVLENEGVIAVFTLQPEIAFRQAKTFSPLEEKIFDEMLNYWPENYVEYKNRARPMVIDVLEQATGPHGARFVDLTDIYGGVEGDVYTDYCHLTPLGNRVLAEALGPTLVEILEQQGVLADEAVAASAAGAANRAR
jgi:lysophospholipase L1-like esterase